jgi:asparagine synthetase B (glutamine-hydrolysing)
VCIAARGYVSPSVTCARRVISDNGREMRTPYLDHSFIALLQLIPTSMLINAAAPSGVGDKVILRRAAAKIGLVSASERPKRAIQFGCRIAKQLNRSFFGASCSGSGTAVIAGLAGARA